MGLGEWQIGLTVASAVFALASVGVGYVKGQRDSASDQQWRDKLDTNVTEIGDATQTLISDPPASYPYVSLDIAQTNGQLKISPVIKVFGDQHLRNSTVSLIEAKYVNWKHNRELLVIRQPVTLYTDPDNTSTPFPYDPQGADRVSMSATFRTDAGMFYQNTAIVKDDNGNYHVENESVYRETNAQSKPILFSRFRNPDGTYSERHSQ